MSKSSDYFEIGPYQISNRVKKVYPPIHTVIDMRNGETRQRSGPAIYEMLLAEGISDSHFNQYADFIRKRDYPTEKEIAERIAYEEKRKARAEIRKREQEEQTKIIDTYKASSYLEKLKAKHSAKVERDDEIRGRGGGDEEEQPTVCVN